MEEIPAQPRNNRRRMAVSAEPVSALSSFVQAPKSPKTPEVYAKLEEILGKNILFAHLDKENRRELFDFMGQARFAAGSVVIAQDDPVANHLYVVDSGKLDVFKDYKDGRGDQKVFHYEAGGVFGELALMYNTPRAATVKAVSDVVLWSIDRMTFQKLMLSGSKRKRELYSDFLASVPLLSNLDKYEQLKIADALSTEIFENGTDIIRQGEEGDKFYLILEGQVRVTRDGVETHNSPLESWQYFGELALLNNDKRKATCTAIGTVKVAWMDRVSFDALLGSCKEVMDRNKDVYKVEQESNTIVRRVAFGRRGAISGESTESLLSSMDWRPVQTKKSEEVIAHLEETIGESFLLAQLLPAERRQIYECMVAETFPEGANVVVQGDVQADKLYVVESGELDVLKDSFDGKGPVKVFHYSKGGVFGELALMYNTPRAATVKCVTDVKVWSMDRMTFRTRLLTETKRKRELYQEFLAHVSLLQSLDRYDRLKIADALTTEVFADGAVIVREGDPGDKFYLILEGQVKVVKGGVETHNSPLEPWQYFGELALLNDNDKRQATCSAVGLVRVASMDRASFNELLGGVKEELLRNWDFYSARDQPVKQFPARLKRSDSRKNAISSESDVDGALVSPSGRRTDEEFALLERSLGGSLLMSNLDVRGRRDLYNSMTSETFQAGEFVIRQGDEEANKFYVVQSGELDVFKDSGDGNGPVKVFHYSVGGVFGELALMYNTPRAASVRCVSDVQLWSVDRYTFRTLMMHETKKRREMYQEFLGKVPLLQKLDRYERLKIADCLSTETFDDAAVIIKEGDIGDRFYLIIEGQVKVTKDGVETHNSPLHPGQYFGELALLSDDPRKATCRASGTTQVAFMDRESFVRLMGPVKDLMERESHNYAADSGRTVVNVA